MWRRLRRRTLAPSRPVLFAEQIGLALLTALVVVAGVVLVVVLLR